MRQNLAELLSSTVTTTYGSYYGTVLSALATRSRATLADLNRALPKLSSADVRLSLVTLVQQHLVNHHTDETGTTFYEPHWENAYNFTCRLPTLRKFIQERYSEDIAAVFDTLAQAGAISVGDLIAELCLPKPTTNGADHTEPQNEDAQARKTSSKKEKEIHAVLNLLLAAGYVMKVNMRQFWPNYDRDAEAVHETMMHHFPGGASVKKERDTVRLEADKLLRKWRNQDENYMPATVNGAPNKGRKRNHDDDDDGDDEVRPAKRRQLQEDLPVAVEQCKTWLLEHQDPLDHEMVIAVNFNKCAVGLRSHFFVRHCERHVNATTAKIYETLLQRLEATTPRCYDTLQINESERKFFGEQYEEPLQLDIGLSDAISGREVLRYLPPDVDLDKIAPEPEQKGDNDVAISIETSTRVNGHRDEDHGHDRPALTPLSKVEHHLRVLVCDPHQFLKRIDGEWHVPIHSLTQRIIEAEIETIVTHSLGTLPARVIRILKYYGHQELRHLASRAMVTEDAARTACTLLQQAGWIDVVELPRTARREVTKSLWLWSYDVLKARQKCLADSYFTMSRLSMRLQRERQKIERVIDKSERTDVQGNEDKFLNQDEQEALAKFARQTDTVIRQLIRLDEVVAIMRDFSAMEYPHKMWDHGWVDFRSPSRDASEEKDGAEGEDGNGADDEDDDA